MQALWAPWRMQFIGGEKPDGCIFCTFPAQTEDRQNLILGRSKKSFVILNKFPYNNGHLMVIPRRHTADYAALEKDELFDLHELLQLAVKIVHEVYQPDGANLGMNLGESAGAGIADHLHYHVVPRWNGDTNFMPVLTDTKVMIEHLDQSYQSLRAKFDAAL